MNWTSISEAVTAAVLTALLLFVVRLVWQTRPRAAALEWYELSKASVRFEENHSTREIGVRSIMLRNRTRDVKKNIAIFTNHPICGVDIGGSKEFEIQGPDNQKVVISEIQANEDLTISLVSKRFMFLDVDRVMVGDVDEGRAKKVCRLKSGEVIIPIWVLVAFLLASFFQAWQIYSERSQTPAEIHESLD